MAFISSAFALITVAPFDKLLLEHCSFVLYRCQHSLNLWLIVLCVYAYPIHFDPPSNVSSSALVMFIHAWLLCCCFIELIENQLSPKCWIYKQIFLLYICLSTWICSTTVMSSFVLAIVSPMQSVMVWNQWVNMLTKLWTSLVESLFLVPCLLCWSDSKSNRFSIIFFHHFSLCFGLVVLHAAISCFFC